MTTIRHLNIEVTRRCDQQCLYCFNDSSPRARYPEMAVSQWIAFVRHMAIRGLRSLHITGGEPFISPTTLPLLRETQGIGLSTSVLSNGLRIPVVAKKEPELLRRLSVAQISLDSMVGSDHDLRRGKSGAWAQAMQAIDTLRELHVPIEISCTVDNENSRNVSDLAVFARSIGASLIVRPIVSLGRANRSSSEDSRRSRKLEHTSFADVLVPDRFHYVPDEPDSDHSALKVGILTILPDGTFRIGSLRASYGCIGSSAIEAMEAA